MPKVYQCVKCKVIFDSEDFYANVEIEEGNEKYVYIIKVSSNVTGFIEGAGPIHGGEYLCKTCIESTIMRNGLR